MIWIIIYWQSCLCCFWFHGHSIPNSSFIWKTDLLSSSLSHKQYFKRGQRGGNEGLQFWKTVLKNRIISVLAKAISSRFSWWSRCGLCPLSSFLILGCDRFPRDPPNTHTHKKTTRLQGRWSNSATPFVCLLPKHSYLSFRKINGSWEGVCVRFQILPAVWVLNSMCWMAGEKKALSLTQFSSCPPLRG